MTFIFIIVLVDTILEFAVAIKRVIIFTCLTVVKSFILLLLFLLLLLFVYLFTFLRLCSLFLR